MTFASVEGLPKEPNQLGKGVGGGVHDTIALQG